jgi:biotin carboxyl carrier protein
MEAHSEDFLSQSAPPSGDDDAWQSLAQAGTAEQMCQAWLAVLCGMVRRVGAGLLLLKDPDGSYAPVGVWPEDMDLSYLADAARDTLSKRQGVVQKDPSGRTRIAYPLLAGDKLYGAIVLDIQTADDALLNQGMRLTHWGAGWLVNLFNQRELLQQQEQLDQSAFLFDVSLAALGEPDYRKAALAVVNKLAQQFGCHQAQLGLEKGKTVKVLAVSHSAWFDEKANLVNMAAQAMNEAFDQRARVLWPEEDSGPSLITDAARRYAEEGGSEAICSQPLEVGARVVGVVMLERDAPFTSREMAFLDTLALALAPVLDLKKSGEESLIAHARRTGRKWLTRITDSSYPGIKMVVGLVVVLLLAAAFIPVDWRVSSQAVVEGAVQRAAVAPFEGYIREAPARAGDIVRAGQLLASLEDRDLILERTRWQAELEVASRKEREAMANADRVNQRLAAAQANQALAQLNLAEERLSRVAVSAPFDAVVVKGDLSQRLGSPVEMGEVLFELAPLNAWRVILKVDERDIAYVKEGEPGELVLASLPGQAWGFEVKKVTPVSVAEEGRNYFRVEAELRAEPGRGAANLRPNMEGVGKVEAGEKSLLWVWTRRLVDWARMAWWEWTP